ncbi:hypothetical protein [Flavobacterium sp.]|uniref:hypothetical protein n=1 Tax=Flavobacterium sp. TaxID=239 RepID=UPI0039E41050
MKNISFEWTSVKITFVLALNVLISIMYWFAVVKYKETADEIANSYHSRDMILINAIKTTDSNVPEIKILKYQFDYIQKVKKTNLLLAHRFSSYGYAFTVFLCIASVVGGILGFLLLKSGWENSKNFYLKASFLIAFACSTLCGIFPSVLSTKENAASNLSKYNIYNGIQVDIYNIVTDMEGYLKRNTKGSLDSLHIKIFNVSKAIKENQGVDYNFDLTKIPKEIKPLN